jgi:hypothetical protein
MLSSVLWIRIHIQSDWYNFGGSGSRMGHLEAADPDPEPHLNQCPFQPNVQNIDIYDVYWHFCDKKSKTKFDFPACVKLGEGSG